MYFTRKLKPQPLGTDLISVLIILPAILIVYFTWGPRAGWGVVAILESMVIFVHLNMYFKTKNSSFLWLAMAFSIIVVFAFNISVFGMTKKDPEFVPFSIAVIFSIFVMAFIVMHKKIKWRTREMLELAAMPVDETRNGFTERPLSIGKIDATVSEMESFARFLSKNMIAMPYRESGKIVFSLSSSYLKQYGLKRGYEDESWVSFTNGGEVNAYISRNDYLLYRDTFSFDQLCFNLGNLFIEFFEFFKKGEGVRIMDRLNELNLNPITE
jgi:hypothetical protein